MRLTLAAYGWQQSGWSGYYPDDLPPEWRLDYYANEYDAVVVPAESWRGLPQAQLLEWLEDTPQDFRFIWELASEQEAEPLLSLYRQQPQLTLPGGWLLLSAPEGSEESLQQLAPVARCDGPGRCRGPGFATLWVEEGEGLRSLRERVDTLAAEGMAEVVLIVPPSAAAGDNLNRLNTLSQLYSG